MKTKVHYAFSLFCAACLVLIYQKLTGKPITNMIINHSATTSTELTAKTLIEVGPLTMVTIYFIGVFPGSDLFTLDAKMDKRPNRTVFIVVSLITLLALFGVVVTTQLPFVFKTNYLIPFTAGMIVGFVTQTIGVLIYKIENNTFLTRGFWIVMAIIFIIIVYSTIEGR